MVFASTLDRARSLREIARVWRLGSDAYFYTPSAKRGIHTLMELGLLRKVGPAYEVIWSNYPSALAALGLGNTLPSFEAEILNEWGVWQSVLQHPHIKTALLSPRGEKEVLGLSVDHLRRYGWRIPIYAAGAVLAIGGMAEALAKHGIDLQELRANHVFVGMLNAVARGGAGPPQLNLAAMRPQQLATITAAYAELSTTTKQIIQQQIETTLDALRQILSSRK